MKIVQHDDVCLRAYDGKIVVAEKHPNQPWRGTSGEPLDPELIARLEAAPVEERVRVRDGTKPMPPGTYWDFDLGHYVEPDDEEWSQNRREAMAAEKRRRRTERS